MSYTAILGVLLKATASALISHIFFVFLIGKRHCKRVLKSVSSDRECDQEPTTVKSGPDQLITAVATIQCDVNEEMRNLLRETEDLELELGQITSRLESSPEKPVMMRVLQLKSDIRAFREQIVEEIDRLDWQKRLSTSSFTQDAEADADEPSDDFACRFEPTKEEFVEAQENKLEQLKKHLDDLNSLNSADEDEHLQSELQSTYDNYQSASDKLNELKQLNADQLTRRLLQQQLTNYTIEVEIIHQSVLDAEKDETSLPSKLQIIQDGLDQLAFVTGQLKSLKVDDQVELQLTQTKRHLESTITSLTNKKTDVYAELQYNRVKNDFNKNLQDIEMQLDFVDNSESIAARLSHLKHLQELLLSSVDTYESQLKQFTTIQKTSSDDAELHNQINSTIKLKMLELEEQRESNRLAHMTSCGNIRNNLAELKAQLNDKPDKLLLAKCKEELLKLSQNLELIAKHPDYNDVSQAVSVAVLEVEEVKLMVKHKFEGLDKTESELNAILGDIECQLDAVHNDAANQIANQATLELIRKRLDEADSLDIGRTFAKVTDRLRSDVDKLINEITAATELSKIKEEKLERHNQTVLAIGAKHQEPIDETDLPHLEADLAIVNYISEDFAKEFSLDSSETANSLKQLIEVTLTDLNNKLLKWSQHWSWKRSVTDLRQQIVTIPTASDKQQPLEDQIVQLQTSLNDLDIVKQQLIELQAEAMSPDHKKNIEDLNTIVNDTEIAIQQQLTHHGQQQADFEALQQRQMQFVEELERLQTDFRGLTVTTTDNKDKLVELAVLLERVSDSKRISVELIKDANFAGIPITIITETLVELEGKIQLAIERLTKAEIEQEAETQQSIIRGLLDRCKAVANELSFVSSQLDDKSTENPRLVLADCRNQLQLVDEKMGLITQNQDEINADLSLGEAVSKMLLEYDLVASGIKSEEAKLLASESEAQKMLESIGYAIIEIGECKNDQAKQREILVTLSHLEQQLTEVESSDVCKTFNAITDGLRAEIHQLVQQISVEVETERQLQPYRDAVEKTMTQYLKDYLPANVSELTELQNDFQKLCKLEDEFHEQMDNKNESTKSVEQIIEAAKDDLSQLSNSWTEHLNWMGLCEDLRQDINDSQKPSNDHLVTPEKIVKLQKTLEQIRSIKQKVVDLSNMCVSDRQRQDTDDLTQLVNDAELSAKQQLTEVLQLQADLNSVLERKEKLAEAVDKIQTEVESESKPLEKLHLLQLDQLKQISFDLDDDAEAIGLKFDSHSDQLCRLSQITEEKIAKLCEAEQLELAAVTERIKFLQNEMRQGYKSVGQLTSDSPTNIHEALLKLHDLSNKLQLSIIELKEISPGDKSVEDLVAESLQEWDTFSNDIDLRTQTLQRSLNETLQGSCTQIAESYNKAKIMLVDALKSDLSERLSAIEASEVQLISVRDDLHNFQELVNSVNHLEQLQPSLTELHSLLKSSLDEVKLLKDEVTLKLQKLAKFKGKLSEIREELSHLALVDIGFDTMTYETMGRIQVQLEKLNNLKTNLTREVEASETDDIGVDYSETEHLLTELETSIDAHSKWLESANLYSDYSQKSANFHQLVKSTLKRIDGEMLANLSQPHRIEVLTNVSGEVDTAYHSVLDCKQKCLDHSVPVTNSDEIEAELHLIEQQITVELQKTTEELKQLEEEQVELVDEVTPMEMTEAEKAEYSHGLGQARRRSSLFERIKDVVVPQRRRQAAKLEKPPEVDNPAEVAEFRLQLIDQINEYRQIHSAAPLKPADWLSDYAQDWANRLAREGVFEHRPLEKNKFGENIYYSHKPTGDRADPSEVAKHWYGEINDYPYGEGGFSVTTGHVTQMLWKSSKEVGVGMTRVAGGKTYVVANFDPAGNVVGQFKDNVVEPPAE